jgi:hypothetical protein
MLSMVPVVLRTQGLSMLVPHPNKLAREKKTTCNLIDTFVIVQSINLLLSMIWSHVGAR